MLALLAQAQVHSGIMPGISWALYAVAIAAFVWSMRQVPAPQLAQSQLFASASAHAHPIRWHQRARLAVALLCSGVGSWQFAQANPTAGWRWHLASVVALLIAFVSMPFMPRPKAGRIGLLPVGLCAIVFGLALALRLPSKNTPCVGATHWAVWPCSA
ncbi:MAG: hypothetical protein HC853_09970 [Anaerolineae bacterium]|nr:hypothetical protein [Anaerolineae bacterium]